VNELKKRRYWEGKEERKCRLYGMESWEYVWEECRMKGADRSK